jgi:type II secretory pathway pseudopilin PulG
MLAIKTIEAVMKRTFKQSKRSNRGYALLLMMVIFIVVAMLLLGSMMDWTNSSTKQTERNNLFNMATAAAEANTERVIAQMARDFWAQSFNGSSNYAITNLLPDQTGWPVQFSFSNPSNADSLQFVSTTPYDWRTNWITVTNVINPAYSNNPGCVANCTIISTATTVGQPYNVSATVEQDLEFASFPISGGLGYYNLNMEIDPGQPMNLNGEIFCNKSIWARGQGTFNAPVSAAGTLYTTTAADPFLSGKSDSTVAVFNSTQQSPVPSRVMAIGTNTSPDAVRAFLELPPTTVTDPYSPDGQLYFYNAADIIISNAPSGTNNIAAYFQDNGLTFISPDLIITNGVGTNTTYTTNYSFVSNTNFYDYREKKTVSAVQLNAGALKTWLANNANAISWNYQNNTDKGHYINSVYVYNNATASSTNLPAVRVANGASLPSAGLTVMTPDPLYVLGNYNLNNGTDITPGQTNTANTVPAGFIGDSITILSPNWKDTYNASTALTSRTPTNTTVNAATFQGIVESTGTQYSGGFENFLRLLENWGNSSTTTLTYNGSVAVMFPSHYATNFWVNGSPVYNAPKRAWAFDLNFKRQSGQPPCMPQYKVPLPVKWKVY